MLEAIDYVCHDGYSRIEIPYNGGIYVNENDLHDFELRISEKYDKIYRLKRQVTKINLPIIIICESETEGIAMRNALMECAEMDIRAMQQGMLRVGGYYITGYIIKAKNKEYLASKRHLKVTLTFATDCEYWVREQRLTSTPVKNDTQESLDHPYDLPYDFKQTMRIGTMTNNSPFASKFRMEIHGFCRNPAVWIDGHPYKVNCTVNTGEVLTIDSARKEISLTQADGKLVNVFGSRDKESYIFEPIPAGKFDYALSTDFKLVMTVYEERLVPQWT